MQKWIGWYSREAERRCHALIYQTPEGRRVVVTEVRGDGSASLYEDAECVGEVTAYVAHQRPDRPDLPRVQVVTFDYRFGASNGEKDWLV